MIGLFLASFDAGVVLNCSAELRYTIAALCELGKPRSRRARRWCSAVWSLESTRKELHNTVYRIRLAQVGGASGGSTTPATILAARTPHAAASSFVPDVYSRMDVGSPHAVDGAW